MKDNKLIAEFMGEKFTDTSGVVQGLNYKLIEKKHGKGNNGFRFHSSWDWLMPVVEKIESLGYELMIAESRCKINHNTDYSIEEVINIDIIGSKREATYQAVVEFIKIYNNESNKMDNLPPSVQ